MKTQIRKSFIAIMLVFALCISLMPTKVFAAAGVPSEDPPWEYYNFRVRISDEGVVIWDDIATDYEIQVSYVEYPSVEKIRVITEKTKDTNFDLKSVLENILARTGEYSIIVIASNVKGRQEESYIYDPVEYFFVSSLPILPEPQNLRWDGKKAVWDAVDGAEGYIIKLFDKKGLEQSKIKTYDTAYNFEEEDTEEVKDGCWFAVCSYGMPFEDSIFAESTKYGNLGYNGEIDVNGSNEWGIVLSEEGVLSWKPIGNADNYKVSVYEYNNSTGLWEDVETTVNGTNWNIKKYFDDKKAEHGKYSISIKPESSVGNNNAYIQYTYVSQLPKLSLPQNLRWEGTKVIWDKVEGANEYRVALVNPARKIIQSIIVKDTQYELGDKVEQVWRVGVSAEADGYRASDLSRSLDNVNLRQYTVTFDYNGHGSNTVTQKVRVGCNAVEPSRYYEEGWKFERWYEDKEFEKEFSFDIPIEKDITLYAKWEATGGNGGGNGDSAGGIYIGPIVPAQPTEEPKQEDKKEETTAISEEKTPLSAGNDTKQETGKKNSDLKKFTVSKVKSEAVLTKATEKFKNLAVKAVYKIKINDLKNKAGSVKKTEVRLLYKKSVKGYKFYVVDIKTGKRYKAKYDKKKKEFVFKTSKSGNYVIIKEKIK